MSFTEDTEFDILSGNTQPRTSSSSNLRRPDVDVEKQSVGSQCSPTGWAVGILN